ncbi:MAG: amidinotransferase [Armatimonadetes bacterium]|nr:amidinotransferase [Armatimonadota bacterium]
MSDGDPSPQPIQSASSVLMIRPSTAFSNPETLADNSFQSPATPKDALDRVQGEFDGLVCALDSRGVAVTVIQDLPEPPTPDAMFPNNWFSTEPGRLTLYPMLAPSRAAEAKPAVLGHLRSRYPEVLDLRGLPPLEGTGSLVLDRVNRHAYAARSPRTSPVTLAQWALESGYSFTVFDTADAEGVPVYHTNVMMAVGTGWAILCTESVIGNESRLAILEQLEGREVIEITPSQMARFAGNMIELQGAHGPVIAMSANAYGSLESGQIRQLSQHGEPLAVEIATIEQIGGGSVRCMVAELF